MLKVYVSSTKLDLEQERRAVLDWLADNGYERRHSYVADTETVRDSCIADVVDSDIYILILGHRYGFVPAQHNPEGRSITELEYEAARGNGMPIVVFRPTYVKNTALTDIERPEVYAKVLAFAQRVGDSHRPAEVGGLAELVAALSSALTRAVSQRAPAWHWPTAWDATAYAAAKRVNFTGRAWLFDDIESWLANPAMRDLLVRADFGVGKSAFVAEFVHRDGQRPQSERRVAAVHYCQHDTRESLRVATFVRSLAAQLAQALPEYKAAVEASPLARQQLDHAGDDPGSAFEAAVANPLAALELRAAPAVVIVDALDESLEADEPDRLRGGIVQLLSDKAARLPAWIRLLVTSRNNRAVVDRLRFAFGPKEIDAEARLNLEDIETYALARAAEPPLIGLLAESGATPAAFAADLRTKSGGKFLYAVRIIDDLKAGRMQLVQLGRLPPGIEAFYLDAFDRRFGRATCRYADSQRLFGVMAAAREPLSPDSLAQVLGVEVSKLKALRSEAFSDLVRVRDDCWAFDHESLREWLSSDDAEGNPRAGRYAVDLSHARQALAVWAQKRFDADPAHAPLHVLRHLPAYLRDSGKDDCVAPLLARWAWLQAKLSRCGPHALLADFDHAPHYSELDVLSRTLAQCAHVLVDAPEQLAAQLLGRLPVQAAPSLVSLLVDCAAVAGSPWLRPLTPSLPPPSHLSRVLRGHEDLIQSCIFDRDGELLLSASADGTARLWRLSGECAVVLDAASGALNEAAFSHNGQWILTTHEVGGARLWTRGGALARLFETPDGAIRAAFSPDDTLVLVGCRDRVAHLWRIDGTPVATLAGHTKRVVDVAFSPDGRQIATASTDGTARLWRVDGTPLAVLEGHRDLVARAAFSPDGELVATASSDHTARLWRRDGQSVTTLQGHSSAVNYVAFSPDGRLVATASNDNSARLWRTDGTPVATLAGHRGWVNHLAFSPDSRRLVTGSCDNTARLWSNLGELLAVLRGHSGWIVHTAISPDAQTIVTGANDATLRLWRVWDHPAARLPGLPSHVGRVSSIAINDVADLVLTAGEDQHAKLWSLSGELRLDWQAHNSRLTNGEFLPDRQGVVTASSDATARLWDLKGQLRKTLAGHDSTVNIVRANHDGSLLATGSNDGSVRLWSTDGHSLAVLKGHGDAVNHLCFSPDDKLLASASSDTTLRLWSTRGAPVALLEGHGGWVVHVAFSPDGQSLLSCAEDGGVRLWLADGQLLAAWQAHSDVVVCAQFVPAHAQVATASRDGTVRLWSTAGGPLATLTGHSAPLRALVVGTDGRTLVSGDDDGLVRVWRDMLVVAGLNVDAPVVALGETGGLVVCGDALGNVHFLRLVEAGQTGPAMAARATTNV